MSYIILKEGIDETEDILILLESELTIAFYDFDYYGEEKVETIGYHCGIELAKITKTLVSEKSLKIETYITKEEFEKHEKKVLEIWKEKKLKEAEDRRKIIRNNNIYKAEQYQKRLEAMSKGEIEYYEDYTDIPPF